MRISDWSSDVCSSDLDAGTHEQPQKIFRENANPNRRLRAMWTLHVTGGFNINQLISALDDQDEYIRAWAVQLICEDKHVPVKAMDRFYEMGANESSPVVRLYLASALQRINDFSRFTLAYQLVHITADHNQQTYPKII